MNSDSLVHDLKVEATSLPPKDSTSSNVTPKILESKEPIVDAMTQPLKKRLTRSRGRSRCRSLYRARCRIYA